MSTETLRDVRDVAPRRSGRAAAAAGSLRAGVRTRLTESLYRNGYALVANSLLTSALGLAYWVVAARAYSPAVVGLNAALISSMTLLTSISQLNLKSALNRFLPRAGPASRAFVIRAYLLALAATALVSSIFIVGLDVWAPRLEFLTDRPELVVWFVVATMAWTLFVLQDSVLAGIRQAAWVPLENLAFSVGKFALLIGAAAAFPALGVFVSWSLPAMVLVVPVTLFLFRRLIPAHVRQTQGREQPVASWGVARYATADYVAYLIWAGTIAGMPLVVLQQLGSDANAYFYVSWSIAYSLYLISSGMGMSMLAEASLEPSELHAHWRRTIAESARLVVPGALAVAVGAPLILGLIGESYSAEGVTLLRLLALSAIPFVIVAAHVTAARAENRMRVVVGTFAALCGLVFALGLPLMGEIGIVGVGVAWLAAQSTVAAAIVIGRSGHVRWPSWRRRIVSVLSPAVRRCRHWRSRLSSRRARDTALESLRSRRSEASEWRVRRHLVGLNDVAISEVGPRDRAAALLKCARSRHANPSLENQERMLLRLRRDTRLGDWRQLLPRVLASGTVAGRRYLVETRVEGISAEHLLGDGADPDQVAAAAASSITRLHESTESATVVHEALLHDWVDRPLAELRTAVADRSRVRGGERALERLGEEIRRGLAGKRVVTSRVHGDLCPANILMSPDGAEVTGLVDWESGRARGLPTIDLLHLEVTTQMSVRGQEFGEIVAETLASNRQRDSTQLLLTWLHHVAGNVAKSRRYARSRVWVRGNIDPVLATAADGAAFDPAGAAAERPPIAATWRTWRKEIAARLRRGASRAVGAELVAPIAGLSLATALWIVSLGRIDPRAMTDLGLIAVLPVTFYAALLILTVSFGALLQRRKRRPGRTPLLAAHVLALIAFLHATPAIVYDTLRYPWAWKHVGIVDYIGRHGSVMPDIDYLSVYHNWPGFFSLNSLLAQFGVVGDTIELATWAPVFFNVLNFGALLFVFSALTRDRRVVWLGSWLFFITNWVGQDYFSPQAFAFFLYLVVLGIVLRWLGPPGTQTSRTPTGPSAGAPEATTRWSRLRHWWEAQLNGDRATRRMATVFVVFMLIAIASSHALTSVMVTLALAALVLSRACAVRSLPLISAAIVALWTILFAHDAIVGQGLSMLETIRLPWMQAESNLTPVEQLSDGQQLVAMISRGLVVAIVAFAIIGALRQLRAGSLDRRVVLLALTPLLLFAGGSYDGEILFRIYLFAVPFLAFLAARAFLPQAGGSRSWWPAIGSTAAFAVLLSAFLFAYYGKEHENYFTPAEVEASEYLYANAPSGALLIDGTTNYPHSFQDYERFEYLTLSQEPSGSQERILARPVRVLDEWMTDEAYGGAFLIITRSQKVQVSDQGVMPPGSLDRIEQALLNSTRFRVVFHNRDAIIFAPASARGGASS